MTREDKINIMVKDDIDWIRKSLVEYNDEEFLDTVLRGNSGWKQYSELTDEEISIEYNDRNSEGELDNLL